MSNKDRFILYDNDNEFEYNKNKSEINLFFENNLEVKLPNRVERIAYCRNLLLKEIEDKKTTYDFYIPLDLDVELFSQISTYKFIDILTHIQKNEGIDALFPFSLPYYYDLAALRAESWLNEDIWIKFNKLAKKLKVGIIFLRIFLIFNRQIKQPKNKDRKSVV